MRTITLEEHYASPAYLAGPGKEMTEQAKKPGSPIANVIAQLPEIGEQRIAAMDKAGIDVQILSLTSPGVEQLDAKTAITVSREANDFLAAAIQKKPTRFAGFAALPTADPQAAVAELERMVGKYGFKGAVINGHVNGRYLDDPFFGPILERAEALNVPIYLHPTQSPQPVRDAWFGGFSPAVSNILAGAGWGWHIETALHVIRMVIGGVFDKYPRLQIVIGHMGESLPFMINRFDIMPKELTKLQRPFSSYLRENIHYTFAGFNYTATFLDLLLEVGADRIMFSADHPYASMIAARAFLDKIPVSEADRHKIAHGNAEHLYGI
jgi:predicted TIM-barrel fold metal-dependent hydrolase